MALTKEDILKKVDTSALLMRPLPEWRPTLSKECNVYVFGENYLAKRFDQINYKFCSKEEAKEILVDNLFALLRYKYFPISTEEIDDRIYKIVASFTANLKTTLRKVSFDLHTDCLQMKTLPDECVAFRNGVFDFKKNDWLFKYDVVSLDKIMNKIYMYDDSYAIMWYFDYDFEPLPINISDITLDQFIGIMKELTKVKETRNLCFELLYNISHNSGDEFEFKKFNHVCEILGYTVLQSFSQYFIMLIGSGQNGKNSLFDGCFSNRVVPRPASNDLDSIESDRFITGSLENHSHNIFLETSAKTYTESKMIKALTGSMYQTIESKGISKYSGVINCKYIFAGNDQDKIKFSDTTTGFRRRINMLEIWYHWDHDKRFLKKGDYYDTTFSDSLAELKDDVMNTTAYVYFAMYGIMSATDNFTKNFQFTANDWNYRYTDVDMTMKDKIDGIHITDFVNYIRSSTRAYEEGKTAFYDIRKNRLYNSRFLLELGYKSYEDMLKLFSDEEAYTNFFTEHDIYLNVKFLQNVLKDYTPASTFSSMLKKMYTIKQFEMLNSNKSYAKVTFNKGRLKILK